ncbi:MAG TPA: YihY/virulence factor BrkB family protein [Gaiellaceae bacterium]|nr:YihY/virulence factor BrkB family protein [Gaiellaceae bacterium]
MRTELSLRRLRPLAKAVAADFTKYDLLTYSSAMAFQVLYAVLPTAMLGLAFLGIFGEQSLYTHHIAHTLQRTLSHDAFSLTDRTALRAVGPERFWWATIGLVVTLWGVGAALRSMMTPLNEIYGARETRSWLHRLLVSIGGGTIVVVCVYCAILVVLGGRLVHVGGVLAVLLFAARWLIAVVLLLATVATLIRTVPAKKRPVEWISVGSGLSALCWIVATIGFGVYISTVSYSSFYGAFAAIILLLIYLHVSAIAFLLGVTVDAQLRERIKR